MAKIGRTEVLTKRAVVTNSSGRVTIATPTSGKKARIISVNAKYDNVAGVSLEFYFGTGTDIQTNAGKEIADTLVDINDNPDFAMVWPDRSGPIGAVDDVISVRAGAAVAGTATFLVVYREE